MSFRRLKRAMLGVAVAAAIGASAALAGCTIETNHPRAQITIEFNGTEYVLEYTMYRNMYPQTVRHFIELAEAGYYDGTIIHDYQSNDWYGGAYKYNADAYAEAYDSLAMDDYLSDPANFLEDDYISLFKAGSLTPSVFRDGGYTQDNDGNMLPVEGDALPTLYGEFPNNGHTVENGQRGSEYGALKMFYTVGSDDDNARTHVLVNTAGGQVLTREYYSNSATSLFALQVGSSSSLSTSSYATFAYLSDDNSEAVLDDLRDDIDNYIDDELSSESDFTTKVETEVDRDDSLLVGPVQVEYSVTESAIVIKSVVITRY